MPDRPNILFIMTDDHAAHAMGCYVAASTARRTSTGSPVKVPGSTAASYQQHLRAKPRGDTHRHLHHVNGVTTIGAHLDNRLPNVAKELNAAGYQTAVFGKWHLGDAEPHWPSGFDEWKVLQSQGSYFDPQMNCNGELRTFEGYTTDVITDLTLDYLARRDKDRPFFVKCHHKAPHRPWDPDEMHARLYRRAHLPAPHLRRRLLQPVDRRREARMRIADHMTYRDLKLIPPPGIQRLATVPNPDDVTGFTLTPEEVGIPVSFEDPADLKDFKYQRYIKGYLRCVASVDDNVGRVLGISRPRASPMTPIVIYTSDQGFFLGDHGWYDKRLMYEESLRMPFLVRYPPAVETRHRRRRDRHQCRLCADLLRLDRPRQTGLHAGTFFRRLLHGEVPSDWPQSMYYRYWQHLAHHYVGAHYGVRTKTHKLIYYYGEALGQPATIDESKPKEWELFDLVADPYEMNSVYGRTEYANVQASLTAELARLQGVVGDEPFAE